MRKYFDFVEGTDGRAVRGASVAVKSYPTDVLAPLYSDAAGLVPISNPVTTDAAGYYEFYIAEGHYTLYVSGPGLSTRTITDVAIFDGDAIVDASTNAAAAAASAASAAASASAAATSSGSASTSATTAQTSATNAATSATNAATAASTATTQAGIATTAKVDAQAAAARAQSSSTALIFTFDSATGDADPGAGKIRLNNATLSSVTAAYVDNTEQGGADVSSVLDILDDSTSTNKAILVLREGATGKVAVFRVTGSIVDGTGYRKLTLAWVGGSTGGFTDANSVGFTFSIIGDVGATGPQGDAGAAGATGPQGPTGSASAASSIQFPATQVPSSDPNALDDYEEGTFTPSLQGTVSSTGIAYLFQVGAYTKVGRAVHVRLHIEVSSMGSASGAVQVAGLPFASANVTRAYISFTFRAAGLTGISGAMQCYMGNNSTVINLEQLGTGAGSALSVSNFTSSSVVTISGTYFV